MPAENPFVYGEVVPRSAFVGPRGRAGPAGGRPGGRAENLPDLARAGTASPRSSRQTFAHARRGGAWRRSRLPSAVSVRTSPSSRATRGRWPPSTTRAAGARGSATCSPSRCRRCARGRRGRRLGGVSHGALRSRCRQARRRRCSRCRPASPRGSVAAWSSPSTSSRRSRAIDDGGVEQALRAAVQQQRQVGYVFAGSEPSLMEQMVSPRRPFYKAGPVIRLGKIAPDVFTRVHRGSIPPVGPRAEAGIGAAIVDVSGNLPYDVQRLAHETWDDVRRAPPPRDSTTCMPRCTGCWPNRTCSSRPSGSA